MSSIKLAFDDRCAVQDKAQAIVDKLTEMRLRKAAYKIREVISEMLTFKYFSAPHWHRIRPNSPLERMDAGDTMKDPCGRRVPWRQIRP